MNKLAFAVLPIVFCLQTLSPAYGDEKLATQGQFAVRLAEKLGHQKGLNEEKAIQLLSQLSIYPGVGPRVSWKKKSLATTKFVADIQASIQVVLKGVAQSLNIPPPPTLDLYIFELPPSAQRATFPAEISHTSSSNGSNARGIPPSDPPPVPGANAYFGPPPTLEKINLPPSVNPVSEPNGITTDTVLGTATKPDDSPIIDDQVISAFAKESEVPVIIELRQPKRNTHDAKPTEAEVAEAQRSILDKLTTSEFRVKHKYQSVFSFSGWITKEGLIKLQRDPDVFRIQFDGLDQPQRVQ